MEAESSDRGVVEVDPGLALTEDALRKSIRGNSTALLKRCQDTPFAEIKIPLCRMELMTEVRLPMDPDVDRLCGEFSGGYKSGGPVFYVSTTSYTLEVKMVTDEIRKMWSPTWQHKDQLFEEHLRSNPALLKYSNRMFFVWDGNHRLKAWLPYIEECHPEDPAFHVPVRAIVLKVTDENRDLVLNAMTDWNK